MFKLGFPDEWNNRRWPVSLMLILLFGVTLLAPAAMAFGVRQALILPRKALPLIGILLNGAYLTAFLLFFMFVFVLQNLT